jgi:hypothetical protein
MLSHLLAPALLLLVGSALAAPLDAIDECTTFPTWTVTGFKSNTSDSVGAANNNAALGSASFTLTNDLTGATDALTCSLQVNYRCIIAGTPSDGNLTVNVAVRAGSLTLLLDEAVECPGRMT